MRLSVDLVLVHRVGVRPRCNLSAETAGLISPSRSLQRNAMIESVIVARYTPIYRTLPSAADPHSARCLSRTLTGAPWAATSSTTTTRGDALGYVTARMTRGSLR